MSEITAILMLEIMGKPKEFVEAELKKLVDNLGKEKDIEIKEKKLLKAKQVEDKDLYGCFAEVELETTLDKLMMIIFTYMPSHIEILRPDNLKIKNSDLNVFLNELSRKLHQYDELARTLMIERQIIAKQIQEGRVKIMQEDKPKKKTKKKTKKKK